MEAHLLAASSDHTRLAIQVAGCSDDPLVVLVHGWAQSARCWQHQLARPHGLLLAAVDLRGHGDSDAPPSGYGDPVAWADDLDAVLGALGRRPAVLVGWSYGGLVIADYLSRHGPAGVAGVLLTGAITGIGRGVAAGRIGPAMRAALPAALAEDPTVAEPALAEFVRQLTPRPLPAELSAALLAAALATPARVRAALFDRTADGAALPAAVAAGRLPVLVQHGTADQVVDQATARHHLASIPAARADWWIGHGHLPFVEDSQRFGNTLRAFVTRCTTDRERMG